MNSKDFELLASAKLKGKRRLTKISDKITSTDQSSRKKISNESLTSMNSYYDPSKKTRDPFDLIDYQKFQNGTVRDEKNCDDRSDSIYFFFFTFSHNHSLLKSN